MTQEWFSGRREQNVFLCLKKWNDLLYLFVWFVSFCLLFCFLHSPGWNGRRHMFRFVSLFLYLSVFHLHKLVCRYLIEHPLMASTLTTLTLTLCDPVVFHRHYLISFFNRNKASTLEVFCIIIISPVKDPWPRLRSF